MFINIGKYFYRGNLSKGWRRKMIEILTEKELKATATLRAQFSRNLETTSVVDKLFVENFYRVI